MNQAKDVPRAVASLELMWDPKEWGELEERKQANGEQSDFRPALCLGKSLEFQVRLKDNFTMVLTDASHGQGINLGVHFLSEMNQPLWI